LAELRRLTQHKEVNDALLDALSSNDDLVAYNIVARGLMNGSTPRQTVFRQLMAWQFRAVDGAWSGWRNC